MKASDLMVGDWVYNKHHKKNIQITPYDFFNHGHNGFGKQFLPTNPKLISGNDFDPIPLTEDILVKNGWRKEPITIDGDYADWYGEIPICQEEDEFNYERIELTYVHTLQHLLRLVGVEKEIEL